MSDGAAPEWSAELTVDVELARSLIGTQFPELELRSLELAGEGWDVTVWLVDERWVFRLPRRQIAIAGIEREIENVPRLAPLVPLQIPEPVFVGRPADGYPWPFYGAAFIPGREVADAELSDANRVRLARPLAEFLRTLHSIDVALFDTLPPDPNRRSDMTLRVPMTVDRLAQIAKLGLWNAPAHLDRLLEDASRLPPAGASVVAHGDLHFRHLLVDDEGALSGVIDWGDLCRSDPSIDLLLLWSFLPPEGRRDFLDAYGPISEPQLLRARVLALFLCTTLAIYGNHEGMANVEREAIAGLERAMAD